METPLIRDCCVIVFFINSRVYWSFPCAGEIAWKDGRGIQILEVRSELLDANSVDWKTSGET